MGSIDGYIPEPPQLTIFATVNTVAKRTTEKIVFMAAPTQYMPPLKGVSTSPRQPLPARCKLNLASPRYTKADGKPWAPDIKLNGRTMIYGALNRIVREPPEQDTSHGKIKYIKLTIAEVVYTTGGSPATPASKLDPGKFCHNLPSLHA